MMLNRSMRVIDDAKRVVYVPRRALGGTTVVAGANLCAFVGSNRSLATPEIGGGEIVALRAKGVRFEEYDNRRVPNCEWDRDERNCDDHVWFRDTKGNLAAIVQPVTRWATQTDLSVVRAHPPRDASWRSRFSVRAG